MDATVTIRLNDAEDLEKVVAFLSRYGQVQVARAGESKVYSLYETLVEDWTGTQATTSRVYQVSRAQLETISTDNLNPWDFFLTVERDRVMVLISNLQRDALEIAKKNMERCTSMWKARMRELDAENADGTTKVVRCPYIVPKAEWVEEI